MRSHGQRRILALGLPLLDGLSVAELRSVVAHEYGHFTGGDTKLGGLIYSTRSAVMRTVTTLDKVGNGAFLIYVLRLPFLGYAKLFLRITQAMSRRQEYAADELAAKVAGSAAAASALARLDDLGESWNAFLFGELADAHFLPQGPVGLLEPVPGRADAVGHRPEGGYEIAGFVRQRPDLRDLVGLVGADPTGGRRQFHDRRRDQPVQPLRQGQGHRGGQQQHGEADGRGEQDPVAKV